MCVYMDVRWLTFHVKRIFSYVSSPLTEDYLARIYFDLTKPGSFQSAKKLYQTVKREGVYNISRYEIQKWLQKQKTYSLQKATRHTFQKIPVVVAGKDDQWSADLMDMIKYSKQNKNVKYVLVVVDTFSKYLWLRLLKDKTGASVVKKHSAIFFGKREFPIEYNLIKAKNFVPQF